MFPIFFLYLRHNSLRFFYTLSCDSISFFSLSYSRGRGQTKGWKDESEMRPLDTKATRCVETRAVMSSLHPFVHSVPSLVCATAPTRRYLRSRQESQGIPQVSRESILHDYSRMLHIICTRTFHRKFSDCFGAFP